MPVSFDLLEERQRFPATMLSILQVVLRLVPCGTFVERERLVDWLHILLSLHGCATTIRLLARSRTHVGDCRKVSGSSAAKLSSRITRSDPCSRARAIYIRLRSHARAANPFRQPS